MRTSSRMKSRQQGAVVGPKTKTGEVSVLYFAHKQGHLPNLLLKTPSCTCGSTTFLPYHNRYTGYFEHCKLTLPFLPLLLWSVISGHTPLKTRWTSSTNKFPSVVIVLLNGCSAKIRFSLVKKCDSKNMGKNTSGQWMGGWSCMSTLNKWTECNNPTLNNLSESVHFWGRSWEYLGDLGKSWFIKFYKSIAEVLFIWAKEPFGEPSPHCNYEDKISYFL